MATETAEKVQPSITPVDLDSIPSIQREGKSQRIVEAFLESGADAVEVTDGTKGFGASLKRYIKNADLGDRVEVLNRAGHLYLRYKTDGDEVAADES